MIHTETPYEVEAVCGRIEVINKEGVVVAKCNNPANAEFIKEACNAHDQLVTVTSDLTAALKSSHNHLDAMAEASRIKELVLQQLVKALKSVRADLSDAYTKGPAIASAMSTIDAALTAANPLPSKRFKICDRKNGVLDLGTFYGETSDDALNAMARAFGYIDFEGSRAAFSNDLTITEVK